MSGLVYRGFVTGNGFKRLGDTLRYLQAIEKRLEKLAVDPHRDRAQNAESRKRPAGVATMDK
ncbi:ATP-dependent RNA helicase HrpA [Salmonella enterica subsp. enterica]|uniref:ATP-dependent RNA helicase HrpA n=1 Tax=Salmonella enterica I TaxID=59201 RepID=A0A447U2Q8_SALET|nr:ATP-dependent RNA helicase HrpA [Salmonella enterica subsp. enterica]